MAAPDGGWGWVVVGATFVLYFILGGIERSYGVWYVEILDRYEASSALSEWLIGVHCALRALTYPLVTMLYARISLRVLGVIGAVGSGLSILLCAYTDSFVVLFVSFGIVGGCMGSLLQYVAQVVLVEYFEKKKSLALGIATSGSGVGGLILSPFLSFCFENFSYCESITFLACIVMQSTIACTLCFPVYEVGFEDDETLTLLDHDHQKNSFSSRAREQPQLRIRKVQGRRLFEPDLLWNPIMLLHLLGALAITIGGFPVGQLVVHFAVTRGLTLESASLLLVGSGVVEILFRIFSGLLFNFKRAAIPLWSSCPAGVAVCALLITVSYSYWEFQPWLALAVGFYCLVHGFSPLIFSRLFEKEAFGAAFALFNNAMGIGTLLGAYLAGYMKDVSGSYEQSYYIMAALCFVASIIYWITSLMANHAKATGKYRMYVSMKI